MAAQQPSYAHPGPSSYYPPPPFPYAPHASAHAPYQYQYPIPAINGHPHPHPPSSPRVNPQGRGYPPSRAGPSYQNYQHHPQSHHHHYSYPQHSPHSPAPYLPPPPQHPHPHGKYHPPPVAYSPNYPLHPSSPYHTAWQPQQPLSPLPKQLSMLPPLSPHAADLPPPFDHTPTPDSDPAEIPVDESPPHSFSVPSSPSSSSVSSPKTMASTDLEYVIWSHRPSNPSTAPGIIISPRARPPGYVIQKALALSSPPPSPTPTEVVIPDCAPTPTPLDPPSSADTETTPATSTAPNTSVPTSPVSTNTSLSAADSPGKQKLDEPPQPDRVVTPQPDVAAESVSTEQSAGPPPREPTATPPPAKPAAPKPSWASLLRKDAASPSKPNSLPTSSIVGFSIPASALAASSTEPQVSPSKKPELLSLLTSGPASQPAMRIRPRGLINTGNMCFANAVLQVLIYCPPFWRLFHELGRFLDTPTDGDVSNSKTPLVVATVKFLKEFIPKTKPPPEGKGKAVDRTNNGYSDEEDNLMDSFIPTYVYDALKEKKRFDHMRGGHQEDAEEFLGFYLDTLEEELLSISSSLVTKTEADQSHSETQNGLAAHEDGPWLEVVKRSRMAITRTAKSTESPITRMFGGKFRSSLRVPHQKESILVEDWRSLRLDIQREQIHTIKDALAYISSPQPVQVTSVTRPGATLDAEQTVHIDALPPILILHLKRFLYDANAGGVAKVGKQMSFASELDVPSEVMAPGKKLHGTRYKLFGVLYHHGLSASGGHYTLDVLHPNIDDVVGTGPTVKPREGWIRIDDELVSDVRPEDVFGTPERDDRCAYPYLLFYRRIGTGVRS
ncbi:cysteine proteinase [Boletus reticuloceps]|uniref:Ubiquitin carboxyl-terminal hydrolase n=1 Tax=Boletus reticuloceps TaxID=495285 RepID=A0A8I2YGN2_9AGAM|nr:cysteine proteinase [Boletus reticuloceps]